MTLIPYPLLSFVSVNEGVLEFAPATLVTPIVGAAVAAVVAAAVLFVLWTGVRIVKLYRQGVKRGNGHFLFQ